jgi:hypothetical protein
VTSRIASRLTVDGVGAGGLVPLRDWSVWGQCGLARGRADARVVSVRIDLGGPTHDFDDDDRVVTGLDAHGSAVVALKLTDAGWVAQ